MSRTLSLHRSLFAFACLMALSGTADAQVFPPPAGAVIVDFDDNAHFCAFNGSVALRDEFDRYGATFSAPGNNGGAVLDQCSSFSGVSGWSPPNFLAFNSDSFLIGDGVPTVPQTIDFLLPASHVQFNAGSATSTSLTAEAFDSMGSSLGSQTLPLTGALRTFSITASGITKLVISGGPSVFLVDDLAFSNTCGNGTVDAGEECDDGNVALGDCCNAACQYDTAGTVCDGDGNECTEDVCDATGTCTHPNDDGASCTDDGNVCTQDVCSGGMCTHPNDDGASCDDDGDQCTQDVCSSGACTHPVHSGACDDGLFCTANDSCVAGVCTGGSGSPCDDNDLCTVDTCDEGDNACNYDGTPRAEASCLAAGSAALTIKKAGTDKESLSWKWGKGAAFDQSAIGSPDSSTIYQLCVYTSVMNTFSEAFTVAAAPGSAWTIKDPKGASYKDPIALPFGLTGLSLTTGLEGKSKIKLKGKGSALPLPAPDASPILDQDPDVVVQLVNSTGSCWHSEFSAVDTKTNATDSFKAVAK